jgi:4-amino-4-deoxy-L-arabinose transferase-like glycosyltransferase
VAGTATTLPGAARGRAAALRRLPPAALPVAIVGLAAALRLIALDRITPNPFYDAAVRSMSQSWRAFFFGALDPGSRVAIDKPPVDLWLQVASTKLLGFTTPALLVPEALAGTLSVLLLFDLLRTLFGRRAGLAGALALAVLPLSVITARSDTMDAVMTALVIGAGALVARAIRHDRPRLLVAAGALMGLAFDVKLFEALVAAPPIALLWWLGAGGSRRARLRAAATAGAALVAVALAWPLAVTVAPGPHPWALGSTDGSVWSSMFVYNGVDRVLGQPAVRVPAPPRDPRPPTAVTRRQRAAAQARLVQAHQQALAAAPAPQGPLRLLSGRARLGERFGLEAAAALAALALALAFGAARRLDRVRRAGLLALGAWLVGGLVLFSAMRGLHPRYLEVLAPAVAGCLGVGVALAWRRGRATGVVAAVALAGLLTTSAITAVNAVHGGVSDSGRPGWITTARVAVLSRYLRDHQGSAHYEFASLAPAKAALFIAHDGRPALVMQAYYGRPIVPVSQLARAVRRGQVRYALVGATCTQSSGDRLTGCSAAARWIRAHGIDVSAQAGQPHAALVYRLTAAAVSRHAPRRSSTSAK